MFKAKIVLTLLVLRAVETLGLVRFGLCQVGFPSLAASGQLRPDDLTMSDFGMQK